ncbi:glycosyl transferase [Planococcus maritimus]|uniref:ATP-grasp fold amidoligase family protein n=1 Tax=Planococcus maritimus TaxID=192421 RepID=UPI0031396FE2
MKKVQYIHSDTFKDPSSFIRKLSYKAVQRSMTHKNIVRLVPDNVFIKALYKIRTGEKLNLKNPNGFNEKLQWIKLNDRKEIYTTMVDKYSVRKYVASKIGTQYLNDLLEVYSSVDEIDWSQLPNQFVLKCTHGSGCNIICPDKNLLNIKEAKKQLEKWMRTNYYFYGREWPYKDIKPKIICEKYIEKNIIDYKFYCFNGEPKFLYTSNFSDESGNMLGNSAQMSFYDMNWDKCEFFREDHESMEINVPKPSKLEEMREIAKSLSANTYFARIDLFYVDEKIYFSEITLTPGSGFTLFHPKTYEEEIGSWMEL